MISWLNSVVWLSKLCLGDEEAADKTEESTDAAEENADSDEAADADAAEDEAE